MKNPVLEHLLELLEDAFDASHEEFLIERRLRHIPGGNLIGGGDLPGLQPGVYLISGEVGLGKTTLLAALGLRHLQTGELVLSLQEASAFREVYDEVIQRFPWAASDFSRHLRLILVRRALVDSGAALRRLSQEFPTAVALVACEPMTAQHLSERRRGTFTQLRLEPFNEEGILDYLAAHSPSPDHLFQWSQRSLEHRLLLGNPLFLKLFAGSSGHPDLSDVLPRMSQVVFRYVDHLLGREAVKSIRLLLDPILRVVAAVSAWDDEVVVAEGAVSRQILMDENLTRALKQHGESVPGILDRFVDMGLLERRLNARYKFTHSFVAQVIHAHAMADDRQWIRVEEAPNQMARETALLVPAFSEAPLEALDQIASSDRALWLRGAAELPGALLKTAGAFERFRQYVLPADLSQTQIELEHRMNLLGGRAAAPIILGLIQAILATQPGHADLLGAIHYFLERWQTTTPEALALDEELRLLLPEPPAPPKSHPFTMEGRRYALARFPVTNAVYAKLFPNERRAMSSRGDHHPRTEVTWLAARLFAWWWHGRLPSKSEWRYASQDFEQQATTWRAANLPEFNADLVGDEHGRELTVSVDDPRLELDPGWDTCRQMIGNVREWCEDGPIQRPDERWTLGGSYYASPRKHLSLEYTVRRADVGFRLLWEEVEHDRDGTRSTRDEAESGRHLTSGRDAARSNLDGGTVRPQGRSAPHPASVSPFEAPRGQWSGKLSPTYSRHSRGSEGTAAHWNREQLLDALQKLLPSQLEEVIFRLGLPSHHLSQQVSVTTRATEVVKMAEQRRDVGLRKLESMVREILHM